MLWKRHRRSVLLVVGVTSVYLLLWLSSSSEEANVEVIKCVHFPGIALLIMFVFVCQCLSSCYLQQLLITLKDVLEQNAFIGAR